MNAVSKTALKDRTPSSKISKTVAGLRFRNRIHATDLLRHLLPVCTDGSCLVVATSRSALPMAKYLASSLRTQFDISLVAGFGISADANSYVGYVTEDGDIHLGSISDKFNLTDETIQRLAQIEIEKIRHLRRLYTPNRPSHDPTDRTLIVIDDGTADAEALIATLRSLNSRCVRKMIVASSVLSAETAQALLREGAEVVCLQMNAHDEIADPANLYENFREPNPLDVIEILNSSAAN